MSRTQTTHYQADAFTTFWWASDDNDQFDRELDLAFLAQGLEYHDHSSGRGLPVARVEASAVDATALASNAVTTAKIANLAVTNAKIAETTIANSKLAGGISADKLVAGVAVANLGYTPLNLAGGTLTGSLAMSDATTLSIIHTGSSGATNLYLEKAGGSGFPLHIHNKEALPGYSIGILNAAGSVWELVASHNQFSYGIPVHMNAASGNSISNMSYGSSAMVTNLNANYLQNQLGSYYGRATHEAFSGAHVFVMGAASIPAGWTRNTSADGRLVMGAGTTSGLSNTFAENTHYGNWKPKADLSASHTLTTSGVPQTADGGITVNPGSSVVVAPHTHGHPTPTITGSILLANTTADWYIASYAMVLCYKT
jgi:hypothetical protein